MGNLKQKKDWDLSYGYAFTYIHLTNQYMKYGIFRAHFDPY